MPSDFFLTK